MTLFTRIACALFALFFANNIFSQNNFFKVIPAASVPQGRQAAQQITKKQILQLDEQAMRGYLLKAPLEFKNNGNTLPLQIPLPDGSMETFNIVESPVLSEKVAANHPEIKSYTGNGQLNKKAVISISFTSSGFSAIILNAGNDAVYFEPWSTAQPGYYFSYFAKDAVSPKSAGKAGNNGVDFIDQKKSNQPSGINRIKNPQPSRINSTGTTLTTFRLAMPADYEFVAQNGGTATSGFNAVVAYVTRIKAFYRNELSVSFLLVSDINMIFADPAHKLYDNSDQSAMLGRNQTICDSMLGSTSYDIGHVWGTTPGSGGGIASRPSVCDNSSKGMGVSGEGDLTAYAQVFMDQLVFHEMGHQFNMSHSYNSSIPVCTTRFPATSVEPGSGATVMSYGFTCSDMTGNDDYPSPPVGGLITGPILQFHTVNYQQAVDYIASLILPVEVTVTPTGNTPPVVTMPSNFTIPISTPFALTGSAIDINSDALTYDWEGTNIGTIVPDATTLANTTQPPFFRTYAPSASGTRTFPLLSAILDGSNYAIGDKLPSTGIITTHTLTVRDNNAAGGGVSSGTVTVTIDGTTGPFLETTNLAGTYVGNSSQTITWSVNGTDAANPNVKISLSTDGGLTFPSVLLASTPNDGTQAVTLPNISTSAARIKVEAVGNIFFDISNANFTITATLPVVLTSFNVALQNKNSAWVTWQTSSELNSKGYDIELMEGTGTFSAVAFVAGKGTTGISSNYSSVVTGLLPGVYYFRLKIIDLDGHFTYSSVKTLTIGGDSRLVTIYPNPTKDGAVSIELPSAMNKKVNIDIINAVGQLISSSGFISYTSPLHIKVPGNEGIYNLRITYSDNSTIFKKIIVMK
jgi:hypothetical protein